MAAVGTAPRRPNRRGQPAGGRAATLPGPVQLIIFLKAPRLGLVKTRLAAVLGGEAALRAHETMARTVCRTMRRLSAVEIRFTPDDAAADVRPWCRPTWPARPQGRGDLGARMHRAFVAAFARGAGPVVLVGSDCPEARAADVRRAAAALAEWDVVLGPARDGGYWLVGLRAPHRPLFRDMPWSTGAVLEETRRRALALGLRVHLLRELSDIDTAEDWAEFRRRCR